MLQCDSNTISAFNSTAPEIYRLQLDVLPEPFVGITTAPVVLLGLNPGFEDQDREVHARPEFQTLLRNNYGETPSNSPFYFLDASFESPGRRWWLRRLRWLVEKCDATALAQSILCVEYFPYHSRRFDHASLQLPSQEYGFGLVRSAVARGAVVVIMRARKLWTSRVPELEKYSRAYTLNSPQNVVVSPRNCAGFDAIVSAVRAGSVNEDFQ
jgi:hypothetical protein